MKTPEKEAENSGTLILDAACAPQAIRFPTDTSLLDEARRNTERIIDALHKAGLTDTAQNIPHHREKAIQRILQGPQENPQKHPGEWKEALTQ